VLGTTGQQPYLNDTNDDSDTEEPKHKNRIRNLLFGQAIAFVACSQNVLSFTLESKLGLAFPNLFLCPAYVLLSLYLFCGRVDLPACDYRVPLTSIGLRVSFAYYLGLSLLDIGPNYLILLALQKTSLTSVSLLGSLTIPSTMMACRWLLQQKFSTHNFLGVALCLCGGIITVLSDRGNTTLAVLKHSSDSSFYGDVLAILAAMIYGVGDAAGEFWAKHVDRKEYLGMIGLLGSMVTFVLFLFLESNNLYDRIVTTSSQTFPTFTIISFIVGYALFLAAYYILATLFLVTCDATLLNLSLQATNLWAILFSVVAFQESPSWSFFLAVALVASGVCIYELHKADSEEDRTKQQNKMPIHNNTHNSDYQSTHYTSIPNGSNV